MGAFCYSSQCTYLGTKDLNNYFTYYLFHENEYFLSEEIITEPCKTDQIDKFLGMTEDKIEHDRGKIGINRICIRDSFKMGLFPNNSLSTVAAPSIAFLVYPCMNSTSNNNSCAPKEAIYDMIPYTTVQTTIPTTIYDFKNYKKLQKNIYDYHFTKLDHSMLKYYQNQLTTSTLYVDDGLLSDNYRSESTNFNPNINYDPNLRKDDDPLFVFECQLSLNFQNYYLRNQKLNEIAGNLGGLINVIFLLGKLLCATYNSIYLKFKIISSTFLFSNSNVKKDGIFPKGMTSSMNISKFSIKSKFAKNFSYMSYLFPSKELRMFYQKGAKNLHEYLDIRKIIKRLQEIDKLKMILLTDEQRRLFEYIPKPDVVNSSNKLFLESILKYTKNVKQKIMTGVPNNMKSLVEEDNPINKRILEFVDSNHLIKNEGLENDGISFIIRIEFFKFLLNQR